MFHTLDDYKNKKYDEKAEKDKKKITDSYTGGKSSGIAVENPQDDDWLQKMKKYDDKEKFSKTKNKLKLTLYKNGFIIDDGEFRNKNEPANKKFMMRIMSHQRKKKNSMLSLGLDKVFLLLIQRGYM